MVMTNRRGHTWKLKEGEENLRRKQGQDKEDDSCQECGGKERKAEKERKQKNWRSRKRKPSSHQIYDKPWCLWSASQDEKQTVTLQVPEPGEKLGRMKKISMKV